MHYVLVMQSKLISLLILLIVICIIVLIYIKENPKLLYQDHIRVGGFNKDCKYYIESKNETLKSTEEFADEVHQILKNIPNISFVRSLIKSESDIYIYLVPRKELDKFHTGKSLDDSTKPHSNPNVRFSVTAYGPNYEKPTSFIDAENYIHGVPESGFDVTGYRNYVILHEILHAIGFDHVECQENQKCHVMHQHTKGIPKNSTPNYMVTLEDLKITKRLPNHPYNNVYFSEFPEVIV